jgi:hypothetical protein
MCRGGVPSWWLYVLGQQATRKLGANMRRRCVYRRAALPRAAVGDLAGRAADLCGRSCSRARRPSGGVDGDRCSAEGGVLLFGRRVGPPGRGGVPWVTARAGAGLVLKFFDGLHFTLEFEDL